jgi:tyrosine-specific transport protein
MNSKVIGGILLIVGTTIGAGMLALPIATAQLGFWMSSALLVGCWAVMTLCAFLFLEVNLWLPRNTNLISMAGATLGWPGQVVAWGAYLILLYSILSAYIAGGGDLFHYLLSSVGFHLPLWVASIGFTALLGAVVFFGIKAVDYVNRGLMFGKMGAYVLLVVLILPFITQTNLDSGGYSNAVFPTSLSVTVVAFTCLMIIPSLRTYFEDDIPALRKVIFFGTLIPLFCYIAWDAVVMGVIPLHGTPGLKDMMHSSSSNSDMVSALSSILNKNTITHLAQFFTSICMATAFLSIALSLSDFLSDGLNINKKGMGNVLIYTATFFPPILAVLFYPDAFIRGLHYAGLSCFILMVFFPPLMAWSGRYFKDMTPAVEGVQYQVRGGKLLLALLMLFGLFMIAISFLGVAV